MNLSKFTNSKICFYHHQLSHGRIGLRSVNTWSPLATAFNSKPNQLQSLSFLKKKTGLFGMPMLNTPDGFYLLKENVICEAEDLVKECCSPYRKRKLVEVFDHLSDSLCQVADLAEFIRMAHPDGSYSNAAENACVTVGGLVEKLNTNRELYNCLKDVVENGDKMETTEVDQHVSKLFLFDFEQSGIHLSESNRQKVASLSESILSMGQYFMHGTLDSRSLPKTSMPEGIRHHFMIEGDKVIIHNLHADSSIEMVREFAYKAFLYPDCDQEDRLANLLRARHSMAVLCGFKSFTHRAVRGSLAETPQLISSFLAQLTESLRDEAKEEFNQMLQLKMKHNKFSKGLNLWDVPFITGLGRQKCFSVQVPDLPAYFSLGAVMEGLNSLFGDLFGVQMVPQEMTHGEMWVPDVYKISIESNTSGQLGYIYCDFYQRPNKVFQDCHFTIRGGKKKRDGSYQNPIVVLHLNLPSPTWSTPSLLSLAMVENLFHEMGHAMHSMLARTQYQHVTGTRCSTDFAEVPSILMEFFANDPRVLHRISRHHKTGEKLPLAVLENVVATKFLFATAETQLQTFYSVLDQRFHGANPLPQNTTTTDILEETQNQIYGLPYVPNTAWHLRFGHLVGYGAKYYSYLMSRTVASWIWHHCFKDDPFNRTQGERLVKEVLRHGGGKPPKEVVAAFLRREITPDTLVEALKGDLREKKERVAQCMG